MGVLTMHDFSQLLHQSQPSLQVLRAGPWSAAAGNDYPIHRHSSWELVYYHAGHIDCLIGGEVHDIRPGVLYIIPPGVAHADIAHTAYKSLWIQFETPDLPWLRSYVDDPERNIGRLCAAVVREFDERALSYGGMTTLLMWQLHIVLHRMSERQQVESAEQLVRHAEGIVAERYHEPLKVREIAQEVGVSDTYLREQFVRLRGCTPSEHVQAIRVKRALELLQHSSLTLELIAESCGYHSASHLTRHVKRATGATPGAVRTQFTAPPLVPSAF
jgi:AraC-like DNA-binding protein